MPDYDTSFFDYVNSGALSSARQVLPEILRLVPVKSVLDVGCGQGAWLSVWKELGVTDLQGIDGDYVERSRLLIDPEAFRAMDLCASFDLGRKYDVVQSLEVGEHLPESRADDFVASLIRHGEIIVFSAAPPGQGGDHHINEQPYEYWRKKFESNGYLPLDCVRPQIADSQQVEPWYRYNTFVYVSGDALATLPQELAAMAIPTEDALIDISPLSYRLRKRVVRLLPVAVATRVAKVKERLIARARGA